MRFQKKKSEKLLPVVEIHPSCTVCLDLHLQLIVLDKILFIEDLDEYLYHTPHDDELKAQWLP
jgi:hypothetical protein